MLTLCVCNYQGDCVLVTIYVSTKETELKVIVCMGGGGGRREERGG